MSAFVQGQEYFINAESAAEAISPVLLYYAILSISRALIIFLSGKSEATLKSSHGLSATGWEQVLKTPGKSVLDLDVSVCDGSYSELADVTKDSILLQCETLDGGCTIAPTTRNLGESASKVITFHDLISREPSVTTLYRQITDNEPNAYPGRIIDIGNELKVKLIYDPVVGPKSIESVRAIFNVSANEDITIVTPDAESHFTYYSYRVPNGSAGIYSPVCPILEQPRDHKLRYIIAPWPNTGYLSPLLRCVAQAYIICMLARYFPSFWMPLIRGQKGDAAFPLLRQTIQHLKDDFPGLARAELRRW